MDNENNMERCYQSLADTCQLLMLKQHPSFTELFASLLACVKERRCAHLLIPLLIISTCPVATADSQYPYLSLPSVTAEIKRYHRQNPEVYERSRVQLSPDGMRVSDATGDSEFLQNFRTDGAWLIDKARMLYVSLVISESSSNSERSTFPSSPQVGVLSAEPCVGSVAQPIGDSIWRGQIVHVWQCESLEGSYFSTQYFSNRWGIVVREERHRQLIEELVDIQSKTFVQDEFIPDKKYRSVDFRELVIGHAKIGKYSE